MQTSENWVQYFTQNLQQHRIDWGIAPNLTIEEKENILKSLQAWQLGETSDGSNLIKAATKYALKLNDENYVEAIKLFIKEEQKHGENLGKYLDLIGEKRIKKNWGDSLFRKFRGLYTDMEFWTIAVITVESAAQIFYQCLKDVTNCKLLKQICTDILIDEAPHISFQIERLQTIFNQKNKLTKYLTYQYYYAFYFATALVVWQAHQKLFKAGGVNFGKYWKKMSLKFEKTIEKLKHTSTTSKLCQS